MNVLLSIKPKYVEAIMSGKKQYEFRKVIFKEKNIEKVYIYSSSPVKQIVGAFTIAEIIEDNPKDLWARCNGESGIPHDEFFNYFNGNARGYAIKINEIEKFDTPLNPREANPDFVPPQSFCYVETPCVSGSSQ